MLLPSEFYYHETQSRVEYTRSFTGNLDVNRLISGEPCWVKPTLPAVDKPKKLILSDWSAVAWQRNKIDAVRNALKELLDKGFALYAWQSGRVELLNKKNLDDFLTDDALKRMNPAHNEDVLQAAIEQQHISRSQLQVIDYHLLNCILQQNYEVPRTLYLTDIHFSNIMYNKNHFKVLQKAQPPYTRFVIDEITLADEHLVESYIKDSLKLPSIEVKDGPYKFMMIDDKAIYDMNALLIKTGKSDEDSVKMGYQTATLKELKKLEFLSIFSHLSNCSSNSPSMTTESLQSLLQLIPNLIQLKVSDVTRFADIPFEANSLLKLQNVGLVNTLLPPTAIHALFSAAPHLKKLEFFTESTSRCALSFPEFKNTLELENLRVRGFISTYNLSNLLTASPHLRTLCLSLRYLQDTLKITPDCLSHLEHLTLECSSSICIENLNRFLESSPNLKTLNLLGADFHEIKSELHFPAQGLLSLSNIEVPENFTVKNLQDLLAAAPNIKELNLAYMKGSRDKFSALHFTPQSLLKLEEIRLPEDFSTKNLQELLLAAPNLKLLDLSHCEGSFDFILKETEPPPPDASIDGIVTMSTAPPTYKHLNISCSKLEAIVTNRRFDNENLIELLSLAPHLKCINLNLMKYSLSPFELDPNSLFELQKITLSGESQTSDSALADILEAAPNLKHLSCPLTSSDKHPKTIKSLLAHKNLDWETCNLSINLLVELLKAAPPSHPYYAQWKEHVEREKMLMKGFGTLSPKNAQQVDPVHSPEAHKESKPTPKNTPFVFQNDNKTQNQEMIIAKLSQYLTLTKQHCDIIYKLQDGICNALTHFFIQKSQQGWEAFMRAVSNWDGNEATLSQSLKTQLSALYQAAETYQLRPNENRQAKQYLGDKCNIILQSLALNSTCILTNPWHAIAVRRKSKTGFEVYDPNFVNGAREVSIDALKKTIQNAIGHLVAIESNESFTPAIANPDAFIEEGGLLSLCIAANAKNILKAISCDKPFTKNALNGLLLRNIQGVPAWVVGLQHPNPSINQLTQNLLKQFRECNADTHQQQLSQSMEAMSDFSKQELRTRIIQTTPLNPQDPLVETARTDLIEVTRSASNKAYYEERLATWKKSKLLTGTLDEYCQQVIHSTNKEGLDTKKQLIEVDSSSTLDSLHYALENYCKRTSRDVFYVDKPEDLICLAPFVHRNASNEGTLHKGPGGALYDFLQAHLHSDPPPVFIINYERFTTEDIIQFNSLLDKERRVDNQLIPKNAKIIGLLNINKPECYQGADFYSRFNAKGHFPFTDATLEQSLPPLAPISEIQQDPNTNHTVINLFHTDNWEGRLLGRWVLMEGKLVFEEGLLHDALQNRCAIEIQNGPWENEAFQRFWERVRRGSIRHAGRLISIPKEISIYRSEGYDWSKLEKNVSIENGLLLKNNTPVLNMGCLNDFFDHYKWDEKKEHLKRNKGLITTSAKQRELHVNVTASISEDAWAMLLNECQGQCKIIAHCAPGIALPKAIQPELPANNLLPIPKWQPKDDNATVVLASSDLDITLDRLNAPNTTWEIIDVSECKPYELLSRLDAGLAQESNTFQFKQTQGALHQAILNKKNLILKGHFSTELSDALAPLLLKRQSQSQSLGRLIILSDETAPFAYHPALKQHHITPEEKTAYLKKRYPKNQCPGLLNALLPFLPTEPVCKIDARAAFLKIHPEANSNDAWKGLYDLPGGVHLTEQSLDFKTSKNQAEAFIKARLNAANKVLTPEPYVYLTGLSGVGKTTFVEKDLCRDGDALFVGEQSMRDWAKAKPNAKNGRSILFLDEANLSQHEWSEFEGLFHTPRSMVIDGVCYPLKPSHKVVFAGNPLSYGDERKLASFFEKHGRAVLFEPLSMAFVYEKCIKPIFEQQGINAAEIEAISKPILSAYRYICECSTTEVLISPRELQMMALLTLTQYQNNRNVSIEAHANQVVYALGKTLVPKDRYFDFENQFKPKQTEAAPEITSLTKAYTITSSRLPIIQQLKARLQLREWRINTKNLNDEQRYGGIGGLTIEGEPGVGKSELVIQSLLSSGYEEEHDFASKTDKEKLFYRLPVNMALPEKKALLSKAFDEGAVVIIDEINSAPMMEQYLNALLMGKNPEKKGDQRPTKPGFMIIGTQNPIGFMGRRAMSPALARRMTLVSLPEYTHDEMLCILKSMSVPVQKARDIVSVYEKQRGYARVNHLSPEPCFRDLLNLAQEPEPTPETIQSDNAHETPSPVSACNELKNCIKQAVDAYVAYNRENCRFSIFHRHGAAGRKRAEAFLESIAKTDDIHALQSMLLHYLSNNTNGNTHPHSFRTMLSNAVLKHYQFPPIRSFNDALHTLSIQFNNQTPVPSLLRKSIDFRAETNYNYR